VLCTHCLLSFTTFTLKILPDFSTDTAVHNTGFSKANLLMVGLVHQVSLGDIFGFHFTVRLKRNRQHNPEDMILEHLRSALPAFLSHAPGGDSALLFVCTHTGHSSNHTDNLKQSK